MDKWIKNNTVVKILAVAVSILLWGMVHIEDVSPTPPKSSMDTSIIENVKIQPTGLDESAYVLSAVDTDRVRMEVKGKRSAITSIFNDDYKVILDLSNVKEGTYTVPLSHQLPSGVELVSMEPSKVTITIEKRTNATFPVSIVTTGIQSEGYAVGKPTIEPGTVKVTLPNSELLTVVKVQGTIDLDGAKESINEKKVKLVALDITGQEVKNAIIEPSVVSVQIPISAPFKTVALDVQYKGKLPEGLVLSSADPNVKEVKLFGPKDTLATIETYNVASVDLKQIDKAGKYTLNVNLELPPGIEKIEPNVVEVTVEVVSVEQITIDNIPIEIEGMSDGTQATVIQPSDKVVSLTLTGASSLLSHLEASDIKVVARVENLKAGTHEVTLQVTLPRFTTLVSEETLMATIEVKDTKTPADTPEPDKPVLDPNDKNPPSDPVTGTPDSEVPPDSNINSGTDPVNPPTGEPNGDSNNKTP
ncbi:CdaR family protein [Paenibacillus macquariensis]|uniref:YbbR domain-containing protein n=1 Tax=Paenibacillus macquariensis TaxID=948756 RepID=A0ABY1KDX8_9BACL|nr:CdaR family protein [Paenibacillus macquariensis]MEC0093917.1 CdaR family protein [Paenibacillus macquariensis]OAB34287.1 hypothetical protein PMSM_13150 [Paenibacillus macquariensis subsp. macquariensis]SIR68178.1 YbbR domain-containing protein [Paenibacillus macquariensis]